MLIPKELADKQTNKKIVGIGGWWCTISL